MTAKDHLVTLGPPLGDAVKCDVFSNKIEKLDKISNGVEHLVAHYYIYFLRNCLSMPKLLSFRHQASVLRK